MRISAWSSDVCSSDLYATPAIYANVKAVFTNTAPVDAYRGAGRPEATFLIERIVECAAREMKIDPAEIRRRTFIRPDQLPYQTPVALQSEERRVGEKCGITCRARWSGYHSKTT